MSAVLESASPSAPTLTLGSGDPGRILVYDGATAIDLAQFHAHVRGVAAWLPAGSHAVNLCEDRYRFLVALCAVALRGQTTLLPPSRASAVVEDVMQRHAGAYALGDEVLEAGPARYHRLPDALPQAAGEPPRVPAGAVAVIGFTSGSTGQPKPYPKTWAQFRDGCGQNLQALRHLWAGTPPAVLATVPPQHMYGMEMSVILPLLGGLAVANGRPLFPQDVANALAALPRPRLLVTTPVHLRTLVAAQVAMPPVDGMVSATAPLPQDLARQAEERFGGPMCEVFGSTETCIFARRRTALETAWTPLPGVRLTPQPDGTLVHAPQLPQPVALADLMEIHADGRFEVKGRQADLLDIAGKRASLGDLTRRLLAVPGVQDGVMVQLETPDEIGVRRIAAVVVAPALDEAGLLAALRQAMDPVFLPRRLRFVERLPRNETGKVPRDRVLALLEPGPGKASSP
ncbi:class I adenylate-forming enzyme family protein [[Pseudomonas] boreopolis]|jgi:acyl-coenzyme A synthetase/AMP-(fatty) acid ligase|uniref:class I adenylate-forming enzyme family protein n=1 Tax=Xanthomonas boreopolis TaxID=86183 RepID=UPI003DA15ED8